MKNEQIAQAFNYGETATTKNFFTENIDGVTIAYSYGEHFPISIKFRDGFIFNKDGYSQSTTRHKNLILSYIKDALNDEDYKTTEQIKRIVNGIKYDGIRTKAELIEKQI